MSWVQPVTNWRLVGPRRAGREQLETGTRSRLGWQSPSFSVFQLRSVAADIAERTGCNTAKLRSCNSAGQPVGGAPDSNTKMCFPRSPIVKVQ